MFRKQTPKGCAHRSPSTREYELFKEFAEEGATLQKGDVYSCRKQTPKGCADRSPSIREYERSSQRRVGEIEGRGQGDKRVCGGVVGVALNHFRTALSPPRKPKHDGGSSPAAYDILPGILGDKQASVKAAAPYLGWSASAAVRRFSLLSKSVPAPRSLFLS